MFLAFKVGTAAFKVGKIAANTNKALKALQHDVRMWEIQINYYSDFYNLMRAKIPPTLYALCVARVRVVEHYVAHLRVKIDRAQVGTKKVQMKLVAKASGELGQTFMQDMEIYFANLEESYQMCMSHIVLHQSDKLDAILQRLQVSDNSVDVRKDTEYISTALDLTVQSRRVIFLLESPQTKVAVGSTVKLVWTTAGDIPFVRISIQVSSMIDQAQNKGKKKYAVLAENIGSDDEAIGRFDWLVPPHFVKENGKHGNYNFKISYKPPPLTESQEAIVKKDFIGTSLVGKKDFVQLPVKAAGDTFKIYDPSVPKASKTAQEHATEAKASVVKTTTSISAAGASAFGKASGFMKRK